MPSAENHREIRARPSPEALLESASREGRGRLKIFLGAAPGVGKTYEMLTSGRARRAEGVDVVIGVVETHGRKETQALVDGFEIVPRRSVDYKGRALEEMDLDAILARRPALVLVDELAQDAEHGAGDVGAGGAVGADRSAGRGLQVGVEVGGVLAAAVADAAQPGGQALDAEPVGPFVATPHAGP